MTDQLHHHERPLRADAERNRAKILDAAAQVFAEQGLDASLDEVAAAAGVGVGTVYRRFPDKDALIGALFDQEKDPVQIIKWKEIIETLEFATDKCEDVANVIETVTLKNA